MNGWRTKNEIKGITATNRACPISRNSSKGTKAANTDPLARFFHRVGRRRRHRVVVINQEPVTADILNATGVGQEIVYRVSVADPGNKLPKTRYVSKSKATSKNTRFPCPPAKAGDPSSSSEDGAIMI
jgi:hypothetical protein